MDSGSGEVVIPNDNASRFWVYMNPGSSAEFSNGARFTGVLYGPGSDTVPAMTAKIVDSADIKGAIVGKTDEAISSGATIHYDESLSNELPMDSTDGNTTNVGFLHVTTTRVAPTSD